MGNDRARALRSNLTDAERKLWLLLRRRYVEGHKFRRQRPIGPYIVDFVCLERGLVIEVDGGQHAEETVYDETRSAYLRRRGFEVIRFWNTDVLSNSYSVMDVIHAALESRPVSRPFLLSIRKRRPLPLA
jgi:very-short-patch-repair endonuclease